MTNVMTREPGSRSGRRRSRARRRLAGRLVVLFVLAALIAGGVAYVARRDPAPNAPAGDAPAGRQRTLLVAGTVVDDLSQQADSLTLFGIEPDATEPIMLFIPAGTFGQIPGQSSIESIGKALTFGREALQQTSVENLLGIAIDDTVVLTDVALGQIIEELGGIDIVVGETLYEADGTGSRVPAFPTGSVHMRGAQAVTYLTFRAEGETELDRFVRAQDVWEAVFERAGSTSVLTTAIDEAASLADVDAQVLASMLGAFASAAADERSYDVLPVDSVGAGSLDEVYEVEREALADRIVMHFGGSLLPGVTDPDARPAIEVRNGSGIPEAGAPAAETLIRAGFKLEVTGNTGRFDEDVTRIVVYGDDAEAMALAERARALLGLGRIEVGTRAQTVVDLTIVVGRDYAGGKV